MRTKQQRVAHFGLGTAAAAQPQYGNSNKTNQFRSHLRLLL